MKGQDDGHAVVDALHVGIGGAGDDDAAAVAPQPGEGEDPALQSFDATSKLEIVGLPAFPLVESVGGNEAAVGTEQVLEHGALGEGLGTGIDDRCAGAWILEPPDAFFGAGGFVLPDGGDLLRRRNVVATMEEGREFEFTQFLQGFLSAFGLCKASAHAGRLNRACEFFNTKIAKAAK